MTYQLLKQPNDAAIPQILSVYRHPSVARFISIDEQHYWDYVTSTECVSFYKVYKENCLVAATHLELDGDVLYMDLVVFPAYQKMGIASEILRDIQRGILVSDFRNIHVSIDERNTASLKLFENAGFVCVGRDDELLEYEYSLCEKGNLDIPGGL